MFTRPQLVGKSLDLMDYVPTCCGFSHCTDRRELRGKSNHDVVYLLDWLDGLWLSHNPLDELYFGFNYLELNAEIFNRNLLEK